MHRREDAEIVRCTNANLRGLESWALKHVRSLGKQPMAWEDAAFGPSADVQKADPPAVVQAWWDFDAPKVAAKRVDLPVVVSSIRHAYLDKSYAENPWEHFWFDVRSAALSKDWRPDLSLHHGDREVCSIFFDESRSSLTSRTERVRESTNRSEFISPVLREPIARLCIL